MGWCKETVHSRATIDSPPVQQSLPAQPRVPRHKKAEQGAYAPLSGIYTKVEYKRNWTIRRSNSNSHVTDQDFTEFDMNGNHFQLLDR